MVVESVFADPANLEPLERLYPEIHWKLIESAETLVGMGREDRNFRLRFSPTSGYGRYVKLPRGAPTAGRFQAAPCSPVG
jgi:hypothetical protein